MTRISSFAPDNLEENFAILEECVCRIYGYTKINDVNFSRVATFMKVYKVKGNEETLNTDANFEGCMLPPCKSELRQHLLRTSYIGQLWSHAYMKIPSITSAVTHGWEQQEDKYIFKWFEGDQMPHVDTITSDREGT